MLGDLVLMFSGMMCGADVDARVVFLLDFRYAKVWGGISYDRSMFRESINQVTSIPRHPSLQIAHDQDLFFSYERTGTEEGGVDVVGRL